MHAVSISRGGVDELLVTAVPGDGADPGGMFGQAMEAVRAADACVISQDVFGASGAHKAGREALTRVCGEIDWPVTWVEGGTAAGTHLHAVSGVPVERIAHEDRIVGSVFESEFCRFCRLGDIRADASLSRTEQAREAFETMETLLDRAGMDFSHVVRTWLYLEDILSWYEDFNQVRTGFFTERGVFEGVVPASTGVGGRDPAGAAVVADAVAVRPKAGSVRISPVTSPLQCPATEYDSSFSRAVEIDAPGCRQLLISGTASIDSDGRSAHRGDVGEQIELTMKVVHAILESRRMGWGDVTRAVAYLKHESDASVLERYRREHLPAAPMITVENDICRDELLFEIEVDAVSIPAGHE
jgi:enamine deaminase RidA (YjgF/YER057c/UK114 family)